MHSSLRRLSALRFEPSQGSELGRVEAQALRVLSLQGFGGHDLELPNLHRAHFCSLEAINTYQVSERAANSHQIIG